jgi:hypothetical protein
MPMPGSYSASPLGLAYPFRNSRSLSLAPHGKLHRRSHQHPAGRRSQYADLIQAIIFQMSSSLLTISP